MELVYLPTFLPYKSTIHVGKYTSPMDATGYEGINQTGGWKPSHLNLSHAL